MTRADGAVVGRTKRPCRRASKEGATLLVDARAGATRGRACPMRAHFDGATTKRRRRRRAGHQVRGSAARSQSRDVKLIRRQSSSMSRSSHSSNAGGFCLCGLSRSGLGCAVRRRDREFVGGSAPSTLGVAVAPSAQSARLQAGPFRAARPLSCSAALRAARFACDPLRMHQLRDVN